LQIAGLGTDDSAAVAKYVATCSPGRSSAGPLERYVTRAKRLRLLDVVDQTPTTTRDHKNAPP